MWVSVNVVAVDDRQAQVAAYLRMLLVRPGEPRDRWLRHQSPCRPAAGPADLDVEAVAAALGFGSTAHPRPLGAQPLDVVRGVLEPAEKEFLDPATLDAFIDAFGLTGRHADRLHGLLRGTDSVRVITGDALRELRRTSTGPAAQILALHELHNLGPDGLPAEHQTIQAFRSNVDGLTTYPFRFDTDQIVIEVVRGGRVGDLYRDDSGLFGVDIVLDRPLAEGETALLHYRTTFLYRDTPPPQFRRGILGSTRDLTLWVRFHPARLPASVWSGRWDRLDQQTIMDRRPMTLDDEHCVHVRYDAVHDSIVGFCWDWS